MTTPTTSTTTLQSTDWALLAVFTIAGALRLLLVHGIALVLLLAGYRPQRPEQKELAPLKTPTRRTAKPAAAKPRKRTPALAQL